MNTTKRLLIPFLLVASILVITSFISATSTDAVNYTSIKVNGIEALPNISNYNVAVLAGQTIPVTVTFTANSNQSNVRLSAELRGYINDVKDEILVGDIEEGQTYIKTLALTVPTDMTDTKSDSINLVLNMWNENFSQQQEIISLRQQRQTYNVQIMSLSSVNSIKAGNILPVDIVLKNTGYNPLNDLYVTISIPALNIKRTAYFGDLQTASSNDTISGRIYLPVPYTAPAGTYTIQAEIKNHNLAETSITTVSITNQFKNNVIVDNPQATVNVGADAIYRLEVVNPTNSIKLYRIVPENSSGVKLSIDSTVVIPAESSRTVILTANANSAGNHHFNVDIFSGNDITGQVSLSLTAIKGISNPATILTIILAITLTVLLVVLVVLLRKKKSNKKPEEFSESYY